MKCVITDYMGDDTAWEEAKLRSAGFLVFVSPTRQSQDWLSEAQTADAIICRHADIGRDEIQQLSRCRIIARYGVGFDNIDVPAASEAGIVVTNVPDFCSQEVAEHVLALLFAIERRITKFDSLIRSGGWQPVPLPEMRPIASLRMGIVGVGRIGASVGGAAKRLGMILHGYDPYVAIPDWMIASKNIRSLAEEVDVLSLHVPLTKETHHLVDREVLSLMRPGSTLINCGRGGLIDESAALEALEEGTLRGIGLDTFTSEPLPSDSPFRSHPNVISTPHIAYMSVRSLEVAKKECVREVIRVCSGEAPLNRVTA